MKDNGAQNLIRVFFTVAGLLAAFYSYLAWRAFNSNPMFFIRNADSERSRITLASSADRVVSRGHPAVIRGQRLYVRVGCALCHGVRAQGGVKNPNYVKDVTPALNTVAERMFLFDREDVETVLRVFDSGRGLGAGENLDVPRAAAVVAQYESIRKVILSGNPAGKKDPLGHPALDMPGWKGRLSEADMNDVISYLLAAYPWDKQ